jgi:hypothetical protein
MHVLNIHIIKLHYISEFVLNLFSNYNVVFMCKKTFIIHVIIHVYKKHLHVP